MKIPLRRIVFAGKIEIYSSQATDGPPTRPLAVDAARTAQLNRLAAWENLDQATRSTDPV